MIKIDGSAYAFNISKMCDFICEKTNREVSETEILDSFDFSNKEEGKSLNAKTVRELKTTGNGLDNIIYDMMKIFIIQVVAYDGEGDIELDELPFGTKIAFNTLISEGFLIEINE